MAIDILWQDENGKTLAIYSGPVIDHTLLNRFPASTACLSAIDPIGDTIFNQIQIKTLASELDAIIFADPARHPHPAIVALREFVQLKIGKSHTYLKFVGD